MDKQLYEDIKYGTNIIPEDEYLDTLTAIADVASDMVVKTLGPHGKTTMLHDGVFTYPTKDGWNVLKSLRWNDPIFNTLYGVLRQVSFDLVSKVGDGTTSAFVGATVFMHYIKEYIKQGDFRQSEFLNNLNEVADSIIENLTNSKYVKKIDLDGDFSDIYRIAEVSSNGNTKLAEMIQKIYQETNNPNIYVTLDPSDKLSYTIQKGYKLDCYVLQQKLYRNGEDGTYGESNPMDIFIFDHNVGFQNHQTIISAIARYSNAHGRPVMIMAPHFDDVLLNVLSTQMQSLAQQGQIPNILLVQVPLSMDIHRKYLSDVVLLTNSQVLDYAKVSAFNALVHNLDHPDEKIEDALLNTDQYMDKTPQDILGMCAGMTRKIIAGEKYLLIQEYETVVNEKIYKNTINDVKEEYLELKRKVEKNSSPLQKEYMDAYQHYTKLSGNLGVILVGGTSDLEKHCLKDSVDDAVLACRSAYDNGYIRGLNLATMNVIKNIMCNKINNPEGSTTVDHMHIYQMVYDVFFTMSMKVLENKNPNTVKSNIILPDESSMIMSNEEILNYAVENELGFDLVHDKLMTDKDCYIVNSIKTDIEVLKGMISIVSTMLTSNQFLSINRSYDRAMGQKQREEMMRQKKVDESVAVANALINVLEKKGVMKALRKLEMKWTKDIGYDQI